MEQTQQIAGQTQDVAQRGLQYTKDQFGQILTQTEEFVREDPTRSLLYAVAAGFVLDRLPLFRIFGGLLRLAMIAFKPAILIYGAMKLYQATQEES